MTGQLSILRDALCASLTTALETSVQELNDAKIGTVYAVLAHCGDGLVSLGLTANTIEHLEAARTSAIATPATDPYWEVHCAEFAYVANWEPFAETNALLDDFYNGYYDGEFDLPPETEPVTYLGQAVIETLQAIDLAQRVDTSGDRTLLQGLGFSDPHGAETHALILRASEVLNTPEWNDKVASVFGPATD